MLPALYARVAYLEGTMEELRRSQTRIEGLLLALDEKMDRRFERMDGRFMWLFGAQLTTLVALVAGLFTIVAKLL
jgi:hypothetical protein